MNFQKDFTDYVLSGHALLSIKTFEKERAILEIIKAMKKEDYSTYIWSIATGWRKPTGEKVCDDSTEPQAAIQATIKPDFQEKSIFILQDFNPYIHKDTYNEFDVIIAWITEIKQILSNTEKIIIFLGPEFQVPLSLRHDVTEIEYDLPDLDDIEKAVKFAQSDVQTAEGKKLTISDKHLQDVVGACRGMTQSQIVDRVTLSIRKTKGLGPEAIKILMHEKADVIRKSGILTYSEPVNGGLNIVGGLDALKKHVMLDLPCFSKEAQEFGIEYPKGVLLIGVPGTGKSLNAVAIASEFNYPLVRLDVGNLMSKWVGESESNMLEATRILESIAPVVLMLDEIEKGFGGIGGESDGGSSQRVFGQFLTWLSDRTSPVYIVATANNIAALPPEFARQGRFDCVFGLDLPIHAERCEIFNIHITKRNRDPKNFDIEELSKLTEGYSGADIEASIKLGLKMAFQAKTDLQQKHIIDGTKSIKPISKVEPDRIEAIRTWCRTRAKAASSSSQIAEEISELSRKVRITGKHQ